MNSLWPGRSGPAESTDDPNGKPSLPGPDVTGEPGVADVGPELRDPAQDDAPSCAAPTRPILRRDTSQPPPPPPPVDSAPLPPPQLQQQQQPPPPQLLQHQRQAPPPPADSPSLSQLRQLASETSISAAASAYAFEYTDVGPYPEEIDEWFAYQFWQWVRLNALQREFDLRWEAQFGTDVLWEDVTEAERTAFIAEAARHLTSRDPTIRRPAIAVIYYLLLGRWVDSANPGLGLVGWNQRISVATSGQLFAMEEGLDMAAATGALGASWTALVAAFEPFW